MANTAPLTTAKVDRPTLLGVLWAGTAITCLFLLLRISIRLHIFRTLSIDDYLLLTAWLMALINTALWQALIARLYFGIALASGHVTILPSNLPTQAEEYLHALLGSYLVQYTALWAVKLSLVFFFRGLGRNVRMQRVFWWATLGVVVGSYVVCVGTVDYGCLGSSFARSSVTCVGPSTTRTELLNLQLSTSLDVISDTAIIGLSTNILWKVQIGLRKKLALFGICSLTAFIIVAAIARYLMATNDDTWDWTVLLLWGAIELYVAIIVACLISFRALFTRSERLHSSSGGPLSSPTKPYYHRHWYHSRGQNSDSGSLNAQRRNTISREPDDPYPLEDLPNGVYVRREFGVRNEKDAV